MDKTRQAGRVNEQFTHRHIWKINWLMAHTALFVWLVSTVSGWSKNAFGRGSANSKHITKLGQSRFSFDIYEFTKSRKTGRVNEQFTHRYLRKIDWLMAHTALFVWLVSTVNGCSKNALERGSASSRHIKNLSNLDFLLISMSLKKGRRAGSMSSLPIDI
jgi:hypothetical protein